MPARYADCFGFIVELPPVGKNGWATKQYTEAVTWSRQDEVQKAICGRDLVEWTNRQLDAVRGGPVQ